MKKGKYTKRGVATKTMLIILAMMLLVGATVGGTLAWLTANSGPVTNTFTVGKITIELTETNNTYKVVPGATDAKDPKVTVEEGSEPCYVYVTVENNLVLNGETVAVPNINENAVDWIQVGETKDNKTLYRYKEEVNALTEEKALQVFTTIEYDGEKINEQNITLLEGQKVIVNAYAHQKAHVDQADADASATAWAFPPAVQG